MKLNQHALLLGQEKVETTPGRDTVVNDTAETQLTGKVTIFSQEGLPVNIKTLYT